MQSLLKTVILLVAAMVIGQCQQGTTPYNQTAIPVKSASGIEGQRTPDLGDGHYLNPIIGGDYPDPSVLRVGDDYYMTHSTFEYTPGLLVWHSKDLVNWTPECNALNSYVGSVFAPDLVRHDSLFYIYFPLVTYVEGQMAGITNAVVYASSPEGPWSDPVDLKIGNIDPGHVADDKGNRYLHM